MITILDHEVDNFNDVACPIEGYIHIIDGMAQGRLWVHRCQGSSLDTPYQTQVGVSLHHMVSSDGVSCP